MKQADIDPRFPAAHYMDGRDLKQPPCLWIRDLDDIVTPRGQEVVASIRAACQCEECAQLRSEKQ